MGESTAVRVSTPTSAMPSMGARPGVVAMLVQNESPSSPQPASAAARATARAARGKRRPTTPEAPPRQMSQRTSACEVVVDGERRSACEAPDVADLRRYEPRGSEVWETDPHL